MKRITAYYNHAITKFLFRFKQHWHLQIRLDYAMEELKLANQVINGTIERDSPLLVEFAVLKERHYRKYGIHPFGKE